MKSYLNDLAPLLVSNDKDKLKQALREQSKLRKEMKTLAAIQGNFLLTGIERISNMEAGTSSSSENSQIEVPFTKRAVETSTAQRHAKHVIHKMVNTIKALYNDDFSKTMQSYIIEMYLSKPQLRAENWQNILEMFNDYIASLERPKEVSSQLENDFKLTITKMYDDEQEKMGSIDAEKAKKVIEEAREEARKAIEEAREEARKAIEEARKEVEKAREEARKEIEKAREEAREEAEKKYAALAERYPDIEESQSESSPKLEQRGKSSHSPKSSPKLESLSELSSSSKPPVIFSPLRDKRKREEEDSSRERKRSHKKNT